MKTTIFTISKESDNFYYLCVNGSCHGKYASLSDAIDRAERKKKVYGNGKIIVDLSGK